jgi:large subunit ribosomal protein L22
MGKPATPRALGDNEAKAVARMLRVSPQKLNLVATGTTKKTQQK